MTIGMFHLFTRGYFCHIQIKNAACKSFFFNSFSPHGLNIQQSIFSKVDTCGPRSNMPIFSNWHAQHAEGHIFFACLRMFNMHIATNWHVWSVLKRKEHKLAMGKFRLYKMEVLHKYSRLVREISVGFLNPLFGQVPEWFTTDSLSVTQIGLVNQFNIFFLEGLVKLQELTDPHNYQASMKPVWIGHHLAPLEI